MVAVMVEDGGRLMVEGGGSEEGRKMKWNTGEAERLRDGEANTQCWAWDSLGRSD